MVEAPILITRYRTKNNKSETTNLTKKLSDLMAASYSLCDTSVTVILSCLVSIHHEDLFALATFASRPNNAAFIENLQFEHVEKAQKDAHVKKIMKG